MQMNLERSTTSTHIGGYRPENIQLQPVRVEQLQIIHFLEGHQLPNAREIDGSGTVLTTKKSQVFN